jgi:L-ascorbate peroxidase
MTRKRDRLIALRAELRKVMEFSLAHPLFLRLAWSDACTYDDSVKEWPLCGGVNGSIRSEHELSMPCNAGLSNAIILLEPLKKRYPDVSWADLIQMAGALAVELCGGPYIDVVFGRIDAADHVPHFQQKVVV